MLYPEIPKGKLKGTYIGGGIFAILLGLPVLVLFISQFFLVAFGISLWDLNNLGLNINLEFLNAVRLYVVYLALPFIMFFINFVGMFIGISRSALFIKGASLAFIISFILQHGLWIINLSEATLQMFSYIAMALVCIGFVLLVVGIVFRFLQSEQLKENKANSFLIFTSCFLFIMGLLDSFGSFFTIPIDVTAWGFTLLMGLYGVAGGLWMLLTCRRSTLYEEQLRKNKNIGVGRNNPAMMPRGNAGFQPQNIPPQNTPQQNNIQNKITPQEEQKINSKMVNIQKATPKAEQKNTEQAKTEQTKTMPKTPPLSPTQAQAIRPPFPPRMPPKMPAGLPQKLPPKLPPKKPTTKEGDK